MEKIVRVLNVFLASPGDVKPERVAAEELANYLNITLGDKLGWHIKLTKWEDTPPASGRPQEIINTSVDDCDLFIGLLWERWGLETGKYSSGFEEEYERVRERRKTTGAPDIWLVFKAISPEKLTDPGPQLKKVLEFRDAQIAQREFLFSEVSDFNDWKAKLPFWLFDHILKLNKTTAAVPQERAPSIPPSESLKSPSSEAALLSNERTVLPEQLKHIADSFYKVISRGDLEFSRQDADVLQEFDIARLFLISATWMSRRSTGEVLGVHEMNLVYKYREEIETTSEEYLQLLRSVVADQTNNLPGWFWFRYMGEETLSNTLLLMGSEDSSALVRARSLHLLRDARIPFAGALSSLPFEDEDQSVRSAAFEYLGAVGEEKDLPDLESLSVRVGEQDRYLAEDARCSILLRVNPVQAIKELVESDTYISKEKLSQFQQVISLADNELLLKGSGNSSGDVRELCVLELASRRQLTREKAQELTEDPAIKIREIAFCELARLGVELNLEAVKISLKPERETSGLFGLGSTLYGDHDQAPNPKLVILASYQSLETAEILKAIDWYSINGPLAYEFVATERFEAISAHIRSDLKAGFARIKEQSINKLNLEYHGISSLKSFIDGANKYEGSIRSDFTLATLTGLAAHGEPADVHFGRQYLADTRHDIKHAALKLVRRFGNAEDAPALLKLSKEEWGKLRDDAGEAALELSAQPFEVAHELAIRHNDRLVKAAFNWLYTQDSSDVRGYFERLLSDDNSTNRERAVYYFSSRPALADLQALLNAQIKQESYYYNVVTWVDRLLYSPTPLTKMFVKELKQRANS